MKGDRATVGVNPGSRRGWHPFRALRTYGAVPKSRAHTSLYALFATVTSMICVMTTASPAAANATVWYAGSSVPAGYLANPGNNAGGLAHMLNNAISSDIWATTPGDYCNYYKTGTQLIYQNSFDQSRITGFNPGAPYYNWQEGDAGSNNVCQAAGATWGFKVTGAANNNCTPNMVCGMHHFYRFGGDIRPWSVTTIPASALTFSVNVKAQTVSLAGGGAAGYFCALLRDVTTPHFIEYCFAEWKVGGGFPGDPLTCADTAPPGYSVDTVWTTFNSGQAWEAERPGSANTFNTVPNNVYQSAAISAQNLQSVISTINSPAPPPKGCRSRGDSTDVRNYRLVGFEDGVEGGGFSTIGGSVSNEKVSTASDTLYPGDTLQSGQTMYSASGGYKIVMQLDGNLVTYNTLNNAVMWSSNTFSQGAYLTMQADGNLVIYSPGGSPIWSSSTFGASGAYAIIQDDGNFVVYQGAQARWSSW